MDRDTLSSIRALARDRSIIGVFERGPAAALGKGKASGLEQVVATTDLGAASLVVMAAARTDSWSNARRSESAGPDPEAVPGRPGGLRQSGAAAPVPRRWRRTDEELVERCAAELRGAIGKERPETVSVVILEPIPPIVDTVAGRAAIVLDGGFTRGTAVLKGLALGATIVVMGRSVLWGLAAGLACALDILSRELRTTMALAGQTSVKNLDRDFVFRVD